MPDATNRDYYWWRCNELAKCSESGTPIPLVKSHLHSLRTMAESAVSSFRTRNPGKFPLCETHLSNIFKDRDARTFTISSLNIKSLQCSVLFTLMSEEGVQNFEDSHTLFNSIISTDSWDTFQGMLDILPDLRTYSTDPTDLIIESELHSGGSSCCPNLENKAIVVPLGEMSLEEIIRSMADNIYLIGLSTTSGFADGLFMDPFTFLIHDLAHRWYRLRNFGSTRETNHNIQVFLDRLFNDDIGESNVHACLVWLFLIIHEPTFPLKQELFFLSGPIDEEKLQYVKDLKVSPKWSETPIDIYDFLLYSFSNMNNRGTLLPKELQDELTTSASVRSSIKEWLRSSWLIFVEVWNMYIGKTVLARPLVNGEKNALFKQRVVQNITNWNKRPRKTTRRKTRRSRRR